MICDVGSFRDIETTYFDPAIFKHALLKHKTSQPVFPKSIMKFLEKRPIPQFSAHPASGLTLSLLMARSQFLSLVCTDTSALVLV